MLRSGIASGKKKKVFVTGVSTAHHYYAALALSSSRFLISFMEVSYTAQGVAHSISIQIR